MGMTLKQIMDSNLSDKLKREVINECLETELRLSDLPKIKAKPCPYCGVKGQIDTVRSMIVCNACRKRVA
jgi:hypothetical protein